MDDKRKQCGCHNHEHIKLPKNWVCAKPCIWPSCLTDEESQQLVKEIEESERG